MLVTLLLEAFVKLTASGEFQECDAFRRTAWFVL